MIKQHFHVKGYWEVIVFYNIDFSLFFNIEQALDRIKFSKNDILKIKGMMFTGKAKAVTCSSLNYHCSVVLFNKHSSSEDYFNSIVHEAEHVKQAMLDAYNIRDAGEPPAYTIGYLISRMYKVFNEILCCNDKAIY